RVRPELDGGQDVHALEEARGLEGAGQAQAGHLVGLERGRLDVADPGGARRWRQVSGEEVDEGGLAGAVRADHRKDLALVDVEVDAVDGDDAAEPLDEPARREDDRPDGRGGRVLLAP